MAETKDLRHFLISLLSLLEEEEFGMVIQFCYSFADLFT